MTKYDYLPAFAVGIVGITFCASAISNIETEAFTEAIAREVAIEILREEFAEEMPAEEPVIEEIAEEIDEPQVTSEPPLVVPTEPEAAKTTAAEEIAPESDWDCMADIDPAELGPNDPILHWVQTEEMGWGCYSDEELAELTLGEYDNGYRERPVTWDEGMLICGDDAKPAIDYSEVDGWWAYCEPGLVD